MYYISQICGTFPSTGWGEKYAYILIIITYNMVECPKCKQQLTEWKTPGNKKTFFECKNPDCIREGVGYKLTRI